MRTVFKLSAPRPAAQRAARAVAALLVVGLASALGGCDFHAGGGQYEIEQVRPRDTPRREYASSGSDAQRFRVQSRAAPRDHNHGAGGGQKGMGQPGSAPFAWTLPSGWTEKSASPMRFGDFAITNRPKVECYLSALPGGGGGVAASINRWRTQMDLPALSENEFTALPPLRVLGKDGVFVALEGNYRGTRKDLDNPDFKMAGVIVEYVGAAVFVKMVGPAADVDAEIENLRALCTSLRPNQMGGSTGGSTGNTGAGADGAFDPAALQWKAPDGWKQSAARQMRVVTFNASDSPGHECYVAMAGGGVTANINRWLGQVGQAPMSDEAIDQLPTIDVLGRPSIIVVAKGEHAGTDGKDTQAAQALIGLVCDLGPQKLFVKMTGPADAVLAERERFEQFCRSLR